MYRDVCIISYPFAQREQNSLALQNKEGRPQLNGSIFGNEKPGFLFCFWSFISRCYEDKRSIYFEHRYGRKSLHEMEESMSTEEGYYLFLKIQKQFQMLFFG